jgi:hypothetical protein
MKIDTTFLKPHVATVTWWAQRAVCRTCAHHETRGTTSNGDGTLGERCKAVLLGDLSDVPAYEAHGGPYKPAPKRIDGRGGTRKTDRAYCIDARLPGSPCGPAALKYEPKEETLRGTRSLLSVP